MNRIRVALAVAAVLAVAGCSDDIFDVTADLKTEQYQADFGTASGTIPVVACDSTSVAACADGSVLSVNTAAVGVPGNVQVATACDAAVNRCSVQATARVAYTVDVLQDDAFESAVASRAVTFVRVADLAYVVPANTLTFDLPRIDIYVGPEGTTQETDPGVVSVGSTPALAAGATLADGHLTVDDASPARATIEDHVRNRRPLVFLLVLSPRLAAGAPIPAGQIEIDVSPRLLIGLPR